MTATIVLLRHGHTAWNRAGRIQGRSDQPLDDSARAHLRGLRLPRNYAGADLLSSPLQRAVETARIVGAREPRTVPELVEMDWGDWEGRKGSELLEEKDSGFRHVEEWGWDFTPPRGESPRKVWQRIEPFVSAARGVAVIVTHIGVMRVFLARATEWNFSGPPPFEIKRGRLYRLEVGEDGSLTYDGAPIRLWLAATT